VIINQNHVGKGRYVCRIVDNHSALRALVSTKEARLDAESSLLNAFHVCKDHSPVTID
jgi:hypothetical protein